MTLLKCCKCGKRTRKYTQSARTAVIVFANSAKVATVSALVSSNNHPIHCQINLRIDARGTIHYARLPQCRLVSIKVLGPRTTSVRANLQENVPRTILQMVFLFVAAALLLLIQN
jgi:hypothetical protein